MAGFEMEGCTKVLKPITTATTHPDDSGLNYRSNHAHPTVDAVRCMCPVIRKCPDEQLLLAERRMSHMIGA